ncbi:MAG: hypothetical protein ACR2OV_08255 [Hyphomicrobiaceae bacterium]
MTSDQKREEIRALVTTAEQQDDPRYAVQVIRQRIAELNNSGQEVPEELIWIQNRYVDECIYASQGR